MLGRNHVFPLDESNKDKELKLWLFWLDNYFFPKNEKIKNLLENNSHLIEGDSLPASYLEFLEHHNSWFMEHLMWKKEGIEYSWHSKRNAPSNFEQEIIDTFKFLKTRHMKALRKLSAITS